MQSESQETQRHRRGDSSPVNPDLVFLRYRDGKEVWVSKERRESVRAKAKVSNAMQRAKPEHKEKMKKYLREYLRKPEQKARMSEYWKQPEQRARRKAQYAPTAAANKAAREALKTPEYFAAKKERRRAQSRTLENAKYQTPMGKVAKICRARILDALKYTKSRKLSKSVILLGCDFDYFRKWIEAKWERGMSWANFGHFWSIDHILPVRSFDLTTLAGQLQCFRFTNTQPLWKLDNIKKSDRLPCGTRARHLNPLSA